MNLQRPDGFNGFLHTADTEELSLNLQPGAFVLDERGISDNFNKTMIELSRYLKSTSRAKNSLIQIPKFKCTYAFFARSSSVSPSGFIDHSLRIPSNHSFCTSTLFPSNLAAIPLDSSGIGNNLTI